MLHMISYRSDAQMSDGPFWWQAIFPAPLGIWYVRCVRDLKIVGVMISVSSSASAAYCGRLCHRLPKVMLNIFAVGPGGTPLLRRTIYKYRNHIEQTGGASQLCRLFNMVILITHGRTQFAVDFCILSTP